MKPIRAAVCSVCVLVVLSIASLFRPPMPSPTAYVVMTYASSLLMMLALFLPGSLFPVRWSQVAAMAMLAAIAAMFYAHRVPDMNQSLHIGTPALRTLGVLLPFALGTTICERGFQVKHLLVVPALTCCAVQIYLLVFQFTMLAGVASMPPGQPLLSVNTAVVVLGGIPLVGVLGWTSVLIGISIADRWKTRSLTWTLLATSAALTGLLCLTVWYWTPYFARSIVKSGHPLPRDVGARLLMFYGSESDREYLWDLLADSKVEQRLEDSSDGTSWRSIAIDFLVDEGGAPAIDRLAETVRANPCRELVSEAAELLAANNRTETAPELMRWALHADNRCLRSLEQMHVREVAMPLVYYSGYIGHLNRIRADRGDVPFHELFGLENLDERITAVLHRPLPFDQVHHWLVEYEENLNGIPTSLDAAKEEEVRLVISAFALKDSAQVRFRTCYGMSCQAPALNWSVPTTDALVAEVERVVAEIDEATKDCGSVQSGAASNEQGDLGGTEE